MFNPTELAAIDRNYFSVITADEYDVTLISKNTHHVWYIHNAELPDRSICIVFHKHNASDLYHQHSRSGTLGKAIKDIKAHDLYQMNGRKPVERRG